MIELSKQIQDAVEVVRARYTATPRVGLILGTGLGDLASQIDEHVTIPYQEIPHFPVSTVATHTGQLVCGELSGHSIFVMEGRFHFYEGYSMQEITFPVRVMQALGVEILLVTNAAGGMNPHYNLADLVILEDHINFMGDNPLIGPNDESLGPRFPDMCAPYDRELIALAEKTSLELGIRAHRGVFVGVAGPNLETRAEYRMLRAWGADMVGMSTVPEVIVANHAGMRVLAFSIVTDLCLPDALEPVDIDAIIKVAGEGGQRLAKVIPEVLRQL